MHCKHRSVQYKYSDSLELDILKRAVDFSFLVKLERYKVKRSSSTKCWKVLLTFKFLLKFFSPMNVVLVLSSLGTEMKTVCTQKRKQNSHWKTAALTQETLSAKSHLDLWLSFPIFSENKVCWRIFFLHFWPLAFDCGVRLHLMSLFIMHNFSHHLTKHGSLPNINNSKHIKQTKAQENTTKKQDKCEFLLQNAFDSATSIQYKY